MLIAFRLFSFRHWTNVFRVTRTYWTTCTIPRFVFSAATTISVGSAYIPTYLFSKIILRGLNVIHLLTKWELGGTSRIFSWWSVYSRSEGERGGRQHTIFAKFSKTTTTTIITTTTTKNDQKNPQTNEKLQKEPRILNPPM